MQGSGANEEVEVTDQRARSAQAAPFPAEKCGNVCIDPEHRHPAQKIIEVLCITLRISRVKNSLVKFSERDDGNPKALGLEFVETGDDRRMGMEIMDHP